MKISDILSEWYKKNRRKLPWRETKDPYLVWLSEIILQQTRVDQGIQYYLRFADRFPRVEELATASEEEVMKMWQGLGYYRRAGNLHLAAKQVVESFGGIFPGNYNDLLQLQGVGRYTAAAVASICNGEPVAVVDGNVARVIARLFGVEEPVNSSAGEKAIYAIAGELLNPGDPGTHNQAMMEFGALQCTPRSPRCSTCPLNLHCMAMSAGKVNELPRKVKKKRAGERFFTYFIIRHENHTWLQKREANDIWQQLYQFPMVESDGLLHREDLAAAFKRFTGIEADGFLLTAISGIIPHQLTHLSVKARFVHVELQQPVPELPSGWIKIPVEKLHDYAVPRLIDRYLEEVRF